MLGGDSRLALLDGARIEVGNLPQDRLGATLGNWILIDSDAAGRGWLTDVAGADSAAFAGMDLLSVVTHEIGHLLGFDHDDANDYGVMAGGLSPGARNGFGAPWYDPGPSRSTGDLRTMLDGMTGWHVPQVALGDLPNRDWEWGSSSGMIDWQGNGGDGWRVKLSPYASDKPAKNASPNFSGFLVKLLGKDRGGAQAAAYDSMGRDLLGANQGKGR
jgi:hypothetical protein